MLAIGSKVEEDAERGRVAFDAELLGLAMSVFVA